MPASTIRPGSLKARLCLEGRERLYDFCERHSVPHQRCGKLLVAAHESEIAELEALRARGIANGATSLEMVDADFVRRKEPHVRAAAAVWSPDTGIVEAEALITALGRLCRDLDVAMLVGTAIVDAAASNGGIELVTPHERFLAHTVVNAAGLARRRRLRDARRKTIPHQAVPGRVRRARAVEARLGERPRVPSSARRWIRLGVHLTRTTWGSVLIGPTAKFQDSKDDYEGARLPLDAFLEPTRTLLPDITLADLQPGGTGIRAKLHGPDQKFADFLIERDVAESECHSGRRDRVAGPHVVPGDWEYGGRDLVRSDGG